MNIGEANAVNVVLRFVLDDTDDSGGKLQEACEVLAAKASKILGAGIRPEQIREAFEQGAIKRPACRECGCTDDAACFPTCWWIEPDLCSACQVRPEDGPGEKP